MSSTLRLRKKPLLDVVQRFDAFEKVQETVREEKRMSGGLIFLVCAVLIVWLVTSEYIYYTTSRFDYRFTVDTDFDKKLHIELDIVVSMPCDSIGADILDVTERPLVHSENQLKMDPVDFELSPAKRQYWDSIRELKKMHRPGQPGLEHLIILSSNIMDDNDTSNAESQSSSDVAVPGENEEEEEAEIMIIQIGLNGIQHQMTSLHKGRSSQKKACRVHGYVKVNKINGNFHITVGKSLPITGGGHVHISAFGDAAYNFSHRIQKLSFGPPIVGMMNPLDGVEEITNDPFQMYQYYAQIVPTKIHHSRLSADVDTCQYAVSKRHRSIDHSSGSHGTPGIFVKYDMNPIKVDVHETHRSYVEFAVRLCAVIGGVFATSGVINLLINGIINFIFCRKTTKPAARVADLKETISNGSDHNHEQDPNKSNPSPPPPPLTPSYGQAFVT